jgi:hypothetical protein
MSFDEYHQSLSANTPPEGLDSLLVALWYDAKGDWGKAHTLAQDIENTRGAWVHAYLHRKEGDNSNAQYWYQRAKRTMPSSSLQQEWNDIAQALVAYENGKIGKSVGLLKGNGQ